MNRVYCLLVCLFCVCQVSLCKELDEKVLFEELDQLLAQRQELWRRFCFMLALLFLCSPSSSS